MIEKYFQREKSSTVISNMQMGAGVVPNQMEQLAIISEIPSDKSLPNPFGKSRLELLEGKVYDEVEPNLNDNNSKIALQTSRLGTHDTRIDVIETGADNGEILYGEPGGYTFVVPTNVTKVSVVAVGAGGGGACCSCYVGGAGGGLAYANNIAVTPGSSIAVCVGCGGLPSSRRTGGQKSWFKSCTDLVAHGGGCCDFTSCYCKGGNYLVKSTLGDSRGGACGGCSRDYGGAGAAGYTGNGGHSGTSSGCATSNAQVGGGGGGGSHCYSSTYGHASGGGVGVYGKGADGKTNAIGPQGSRPTCGWSCSSYNGYGGSGGSGGGDGTFGQQILLTPCNCRAVSGGDYGGGGGGGGSSLHVKGFGGKGAVRIIWGTGRSFPYNAK